MRKLIYILTLTLFASCNKPIDPPLFVPETTPQTTLMYMTGTDLSYFFTQNISAAKSAIEQGALGYGRFLVFKHTDSQNATLFEMELVEGECIQTTIKEYTAISSLSEECITQVILDVVEAAPADSYNLIVSGHGAGWVLKDRLISTWSEGTLSPTALFEQDYSNPLLITRYMGSTKDGYLDISELRTALEASDTRFGYILFDECFMSSVEVVYELRNRADYIIASPCEIMGNGFPYDLVLPELYSNQGMSVDLQGACEEFYKYYSTFSFPSGCIALTVCSELDALASITKEINQAEQNTIDLESLQVYERLASHVFFDLEQYTLALCADQALKERYTEQFDKTFPEPYRLHTERFFANIGPSVSSSNNYEAYYTDINYYSGVTTSAPSQTLQNEWATTLWAIDTK